MPVGHLFAVALPMRWLEGKQKWPSTTWTTFICESRASPKTCAPSSRSLNCAAMQAPSDPELMEALNSLSETEPIDTLRTALDQMRHFLWFYSQVMSNEPELGDKLRQAGLHQPQRTKRPAPTVRFWINSRVPTNSCCCITWRMQDAANPTKSFCASLSLFQVTKRNTS